MSLRRHYKIPDVSAHYVPASSSPAENRQKRRKLLNQHRLAWKGI